MMASAAADMSRDAFKDAPPTRSRVCYRKSRLRVVVQGSAVNIEQLTLLGWRKVITVPPGKWGDRIETVDGKESWFGTVSQAIILAERLVDVIVIDGWSVSACREVFGDPYLEFTFENILKFVAKRNSRRKAIVLVRAGSV